MASKLSPVLDDFQEQLLLLNELVARLPALAPADKQSWDTVNNKLQELYSDFTGHIAILELLLSRSIEGSHTLAELLGVAHTLHRSGRIFETLRAPSLSASSNHAKSAMTAELEDIRTTLRTAMAPVFLSFSRGAETISPTHNPSDAESSTLQSAFSLRPFALTGTDISLLAADLDNQDLTTIVENISTQVNALAKEWVQRQTDTTFGIEPYVLSHFWLGNTSPMKDTQGQLDLPETNNGPYVTEIPIGNWLKHYTSTRNTAALVGPSGSGKSAVINAIVGVHLITPSIPTFVPCRIRHHPDVSEPTLEVAIEPYLVALRLLREYGFTQQCTHWQADHVTVSIGRADAPESFQKAWEAWTTVAPEVAEMITEFERPDFQLAGRVTGLEHVNKMLGYLDAIAFYCDTFGLAFDPFRHEWPVIELAFNPSPGSSQVPELINLPGYTLQTLTEADMPYLDQLLQEGVTIVPVISIEQHNSEEKDLTGKLPELLNHRVSPIPCVIVTYLDAIRQVDSEALESRSLVASMFWDDWDRVNDVLFCSPPESITATFVLHYIDTKGFIPPYEEVWKDEGDLRYWGLRELTGKDNDARARYEKFTKEKIQSIMLKLQDDSCVLPTVTGYYRASTAPTFRDEAAAAFRRRVSGVLKDTLNSIDALLIELGKSEPQKIPGVTSTTSGQELSSHRLNSLLGVIRDRASKEIKICLRNAYAEMCRSQLKAGFSGEDQDDDLLLLKAQSLRGILQHCQKAAELPLAELRSPLAHDLARHGSTEAATDPNTNIGDTISRLPTTSASLPIESLSSFKVSNLRVLVLQPFHERPSPTQRAPSLWRRTGLAIAAFARALFGLPSILIHRRQGYYKLSLAQLSDLFTSEVIVPWLEETARVAERLLKEKADISGVMASSSEIPDPETRRQLGPLVALRCNISAVLAVLV